MYGYNNYQQPFGSYVPQYQNYNSFNNDIQFVNGRSSAEAYIMPPNSKVILMDKEAPVFYLKETDASGMSNVKAYSFTELKEDAANDYVTRKEFDEWRLKYESDIPTEF